MGSLLSAFASLALHVSCTTSGPGDQSDDPTGSPVPQELQGNWQSILTYIPAYYTGVVANDDFGGTLGIFFYFYPDGRYQYDLNTILTYFGGNCFRNTGWTETGTLNIADSQWTLTPNHASYTQLDSCGEAEFIDPAAAVEATVTLTPDADETGWPLLRIVLPNGDELILERCRDCE